jgi:transposase-like protein
MTTNCPSCQSSKIRKNGKSRHGHQRYVCVDCKKTFGDFDGRAVSPESKESALRCYAEGNGLRATERLTGVSHNSVMRWVRKEVAGKAIERVDPATVGAVEADELWSYIGSKKTLFGSGGLLIALPKEYSGGRWAIVTPEQPQRWVRKFLAALTSSTTQTSSPTTATSSRQRSSRKASATPTISKA